MQPARRHFVGASCSCCNLPRAPAACKRSKLSASRSVSQALIDPDSAVRRQWSTVLPDTEVLRLSW